MRRTYHTGLNFVIIAISMKKATDTSADKQDAPLVMGGAATKPRRDNRRLKKNVFVVSLIILVLAAVFTGWWFLIRQDPNYLDISKLNSQDKFVKIAQEYATQPVPDNAKDKAVYYGNIGLALKQGKEYKYAERYYLLAQKIVDENNVDKKDVEFYQGLSDLYKAMGNQAKADEYARKEQDFLKANYPPEVIEQMQKVKLNDPPR